MEWLEIMLFVGGIYGLCYLVGQGVYYLVEKRAEKKAKPVEEDAEEIPSVRLPGPEEKRRKQMKDFAAAWEDCWEFEGAYTFDTKRWNTRYAGTYGKCEDRQVVAAVDRQFREFGTIQLHYLKNLLTEGLDQVPPAYEQTIDQVLENLPYMFSCRNGDLCLVNCPVNVQAFSTGMYNLFHKKIPGTAGEADRLLKLVEGY